MKVPSRLDICQHIFLYNGMTPLKICLDYQQVTEWIEYKRAHGIDDYGRTPEEREQQERWQKMMLDVYTGRDSIIP